MTLHQLYRYYILYPSDKLWLRWTVSVPRDIDTIRTLTKLAGRSNRVRFLSYMAAYMTLNFLPKCPRDCAHGSVLPCLVHLISELFRIIECLPFCSYWYLVSNYFNPLQLQFGSWYISIFAPRDRSDVSVLGLSRWY